MAGVLAPSFNQLSLHAAGFSAVLRLCRRNLQAIRSALPHLASQFADEAFAFQSTVFGLPSQPARWETCVARTDGALGFAVSKLYVDAAFGGDAKAAADTMIEAIRNSFEEGLPALDWMDSETKEQARLKAEAVTTKIGFPDFIMEPDALSSYYREVIVDDSYFGNRQVSLRAETNRNLVISTNSHIFAEPINLSRPRCCSQLLRSLQWHLPTRKCLTDVLWWYNSCSERLGSPSTGASGA